MSEKLFSFGGHFWICGQLVWGLEPTIGDGCSEDTIASRLDISGSEDSWLHNSHQFKRNMNIIYFLKKPSRDSKLPRSVILRLTSITWLACVASVSNRVIARKLERKQKKGWTSRGNACYAGYHLITCANQKSIGSGNTRFFCFTCYAFKQPKRCLWCIITSSQAFFMGKALGTRGQGRVATFLWR